MLREQARIERYETHKAILECKLEEGKSVTIHVFEMIGYFEAMSTDMKDITFHHGF